VGSLRFSGIKQNQKPNFPGQCIASYDIDNPDREPPMILKNKIKESLHLQTDSLEGALKLMIAEGRPK
jgi:hypothetical protein